MKKFTLIFTRRLFLFFLIIMSLSCTPSKKVKVLRLGHGLDTNHPVHKALEELKENVANRSGGRLQLDIYPSGQLGSERECLELLQIGSLDITKVSAAVLENFIPEYQILSIPYLFKNKLHSHLFYDSQTGKELLKKGEAFKLVGLTFFDAGSRNFYTRSKPVYAPDDLENLKIRVQKSQLAIQMISSFHGAPTPISWGELYTALQQGVVDGAENNLPSFYLSKHYEVCKYLTIDEHTMVPDVLLISKNTYERLNSRERFWLERAVYDSTIRQRKLWSEAESFAYEKLLEAGVEIIKPDKTKFEKLTRSIQESYLEDQYMATFINAINTMY